MSPLKKITNSTIWIRYRGMLGLFVFFYASIHLLSYVGIDYRFDFQPIINDVLKKKFIFIGFAAWLLLIPLAITSSNKMMKILKHNWKKIHRLIYVIGVFGVFDEVVLEVIFGNFNPTGKLPFDIPSSMKEVNDQLSDVPDDTRNPIFRYGHGLSYLEE